MRSPRLLIPLVLVLAPLFPPGRADRSPRPRGRKDHVLPQPGRPGLPPRPERRAGGRGLLPRQQQLRALPGGAPLHEPRPRPLEAAGPRADAGEPAAPPEGPPVGRHLRPDDPAPRRHLLHDHDERGRRRELLRDGEGPGGALVRARVAARLRRDRPVALLRRRRDGVPHRPGQRGARAAARHLPDDARRCDREAPRAAPPRVGPHRHAVSRGAAPLQDPRALLPDDRGGRHRVRAHGDDRPRRLAVGPFRGLPPQPRLHAPADRERHAGPGRGSRGPRRGQRRQLVDGLPRLPLRLGLLAPPRPRDVPRPGHLGRGRLAGGERRPPGRPGGAGRRPSVAALPRPARPHAASTRPSGRSGITFATRSGSPTPSRRGRAGSRCAAKRPASAPSAPRRGSRGGSSTWPPACRRSSTSPRVGTARRRGSAST